MTTVLTDNPKTWKTKTERPVTLEIILLKRTYILPWVQFLYAEGGSDEVRLVFATHDVVVKGSGLQSLLTGLAVQRVTQLQEPARADRHENGSAPFVREIEVAKIDEGRS
jgi:hypothetical protein